MSLDFNLSLFSVELAVVALTLGLLILDIFLKNSAQRGRLLANAALLGITVIFFYQLTRLGALGTSLHESFVQDRLSIFFKLLFMLAAFFTVFMIKGYQQKLKRGHGEFVLLVLFALVGLIFLACANDFLLFFISLETLTVSLYIMTAYLRDENASIEAGVKYLILGALSTAIFLYGLSFIYGATGSTSYPVIHDKLALMPSIPTSFLFGMILVISALGFKIAAVPFQLWAPDIYQGAPTPVTAFLAIGSKAAGFAAITRLVLTAFQPAQAELTLLFSVLAGLTIFYGNLGAIPQTNIKRLLGYSSIGHAGYLLMGLAAFSYSGQEALLYYLLSYLISTGGAFLVLVTLTAILKKDEISELAGLSQKSPLLAAAMLLSLLSLAGLPPLVGFFAKFYLLWAAVKADLLWLAAIGLINVITSLYYYLKIVKVMYVDKPLTQETLKISWDQRIFHYACIAGIVALGIYQAPWVRFVELASQNFTR